MMEQVVQYGYKYESDFDVYLVRRLDGESLCNKVPSGLFKMIVIEEEKRLGKKLHIKEDGLVHFNSKGNAAIVDFKGLKYIPLQVDEIVRAINDQYTSPKKENTNVFRRILNRF